MKLTPSSKTKFVHLVIPMFALICADARGEPAPRAVAQRAVPLAPKDSHSSAPDQPNNAAVLTAEPGCDGSTPGLIVLDDNRAESTAGWSDSTVDGQYAQRFTPPVYPATFSRVCVAIEKNVSANTIPMNIIVYAEDGLVGKPGTELGRKSVVAIAEPLPGYPYTPVFHSYDISDLHINLASGNAYVAVEWSQASINFFVGLAADGSPSTPPTTAFYKDSTSASWFPVYNGLGSIGDSALMIRVLPGVNGPAPPLVSLDLAPAGVIVDSPSSLQLTLSNVSQPSPATLTAALSDVLPEGLTIATNPNASTTCPGGVVSTTADSIVLSSGAQIPASGSCVVSADVVSNAPGVYVDELAVGALQTDLGNSYFNANTTLTVYSGQSGTFPANENFDEGPGFPAGWVSSGPGDWQITTSASASAPNAAFVPDNQFVSDMTLDSPAFIAVVGQTVTFQNSYKLDDGVDGGVLEVSLDGAAFTDIVDAGGSFVSGGYNEPLYDGGSNPLHGRNAWSGDSGGFITTTAILPDSAAGKSVVLRFRSGDDGFGALVGWWIDSIHLDSLEHIFGNGFE